MTEPLSIAFVTSEIAPLVATGGLGESVAGLGHALVDLGHEVSVVCPLHRCIRDGLRGDEPRREASVEFAGTALAFDVVTVRLGDRAIPVHLIDAPSFFELSDDIYGWERGPDDIGHLRWLFLAAAVRPALDAVDVTPDVLHAHDWHGAWSLVLDRTDHYFHERTDGVGTVMTVHNGAYQGWQSVLDYHRTELRDDILWSHELQRGDDVSLLKGGVVFGDRITTVSPTYAVELRRRGGADGLELVLESRRDDFRGILNGIDVETWDPSADDAIAAPFSAEDPSGKDACRAALLEELELEPTEGPIFACVARLAEQKGIDIVIDAAGAILRSPGSRLVVLGTGDAEIERRLLAARDRLPGRLACVLRFDPDLAHRVYAGADALLMPSRFEPCGLAAMVAQRYGTLPVVRLTGGLADIVTPLDRRDQAAADGFAFRGRAAGALVRACQRVEEVFSYPNRWASMQRAAMNRDWSWRRAALEYVEVYDEAREGRSFRDAVLLAKLRLEPTVPYIGAQRRIPTHFKRDVLTLAAQAPHRVCAWWETQGEEGRALLETLTEEELWALRWELRMTRVDVPAHWVVEVEGIAKNWFVEVEPGGRYRAELWVSAGGDEPVCMAASGEVETASEPVWSVEGD